MGTQDEALELDESHTAYPSNPLIQYIVIREDLGWPLGAVCAQAAHAGIAAVSDARDANCPDTELYTSKGNRPHMRVSVLAIPNTQKLLQLVEKLKNREVKHHLWVEQPENVPVAIATWPARRAVVQKAFK